ncbi:MAG: hypothetical protein AAFY88_10385 [Acidobacteriota bacterium]
MKRLLVYLPDADHDRLVKSAGSSDATALTIRASQLLRWTLNRTTDKPPAEQFIEWASTAHAPTVATNPPEIHSDSERG